MGKGNVGRARNVSKVSAKWTDYGESHPPDCILAEKSDYDGGDPSLELVKRPDGLYDFIIYKGANDLTVHALSARSVRLAAQRILELIPIAE
jgi:hypothetical protein